MIVIYIEIEVSPFLCYRQVNVKPSERPQDLYGEVANLVEKKRAADAATGDSLAMQLEGILLIPFLFRKWLFLPLLVVTLLNFYLPKEMVLRNTRLFL